ncbi:MAG: UTP--glucose-1-phosphate uridylyltransferase [Holosporales bacterium]|jgi:UTP--glucose-1-phosphate uridylyltransferase|nr:UTP--glucose-1-phosphate uridylyltransferase [Holosporales bacterium]
MSPKIQKVRKAVFPVGGLGTRFLPATKALPKEMFPIIDKPLIQFVVEEALAAGLEELIFVTGRGKDSIENHFDIAFELERTLQDRGKLHVLEEVRACSLEPGCATYMRQQEPRGLGHAVWCARHLVRDEPFAVLLADDLILGGRAPAISELLDLYYQEGSHVVSVMEVPKEQVSRYGILEIEERRGLVCSAQSITEKPQPEETSSRTAVIGRYILSPKIFPFLGRQILGSNGEIQLTDALAATLQEGTPLRGVYSSGRRFDCGLREGMVQATLFCALQEPTLEPSVQEILREWEQEMQEKTA